MLAVASLGSVGSTAGAGTLLLLRTQASRIVPYLVSFATGTLLAGACLGLLQKALARRSTGAYGSSSRGGARAFQAYSAVRGRTGAVSLLLRKVLRVGL